jgi:hypothetical protein
MTRVPHADVAEDKQSLWALAVPPSIWFAHFLASYIGVALWCGNAGRDGSLGWVALGFAVVTVIAMSGIVAAGWFGWRRYKHGNEEGGAVPSHHRDTPEDRHRFLGLATVLLSGLSAIATLYVAVAVAITGNCS